MRRTRPRRRSPPGRTPGSCPSPSWRGGRRSSSPGCPPCGSPPSSSPSWASSVRGRSCAAGPAPCACVGSCSSPHWLCRSGSASRRRRSSRARRGIPRSSTHGAIGSSPSSPESTPRRSPRAPDRSGPATACASGRRRRRSTTARACTSRPPGCWSSRHGRRSISRSDRRSRCAARCIRKDRPRPSAPCCSPIRRCGCAVRPTAWTGWPTGSAPVSPDSPVDSRATAATCCPASRSATRPRSPPRSTRR